MDTPTNPSTPLRTGTLGPKFIDCEYRVGRGSRGTTCAICFDDFDDSSPEQTVTHITCGQAWHLKCWDTFIKHGRKIKAVDRTCVWCRQPLCPKLMYEVFDSLAHLVHTHGANALVPIPDQCWTYGGEFLKPEQLENSDNFPFTLKEERILARLVHDYKIDEFAVLRPDGFCYKRFLVPLEDINRPGYREPPEDSDLESEPDSELDPMVGSSTAHSEVQELEIEPERDLRPMVSSFNDHPEVPELEFDPKSGLLLVDRVTGSDYRPLAWYNKDDYGEEDDSEREHNEGFHNVSYDNRFDHYLDPMDVDDEDDEDDEYDEYDDEASDTEDGATNDIMDES